MPRSERTDSKGQGWEKIRFNATRFSSRHVWAFVIVTLEEFKFDRKLNSYMNWLQRTFVDTDIIPSHRSLWIECNSVLAVNIEEAVSSLHLWAAAGARPALRYTDTSFIITILCTRSRNTPRLLSTKTASLFWGFRYIHPSLRYDTNLTTQPASQWLSQHAQVH